MFDAWLVPCSLREIAAATGLSHVNVKRVIDRICAIDPGKHAIVRDTWSMYKERYNQRPGTFDAIVDVWQRVPRAQQSFTGWSSFSQAANAEAARSPDRVLAAEQAMEAGGYKLGSPTVRGARQWVPS